MKKALLIEVAAVAILLVLAILLNLTVPDAPAQLAEPVQTEPVETFEDVDPEPDVEPEIITWNTYPPTRAISAQQYFVFSPDIEAYAVTAGEDLQTVYPASITKLFTAYVALQYLPSDQYVTVSDAIHMAYPGSSVANLIEGSTLSVEELVAAMLLPSGNDAAYVLAAEAGRVIAGDPDMETSQAVDKFVWCMNEMALTEGMMNTYFENPDGIHSEGHYTSFDDLVTIARLALSEPVIRNYASRSNLTVTTMEGDELQWHNTNELVDPNSEYYCPYAVGLKTGQTPSAGSCLLSAFQCDGVTLIVGVFGCPDETSRFDDSLQLFNQVMGFK